MASLAFLHTSHAHIETFSELVRERAPEIVVHHEVDASLLDDARAAGYVPPWLERRVNLAMKRAAGGGARAVVCTCSTIGGEAEATETKGRYSAMRIDRPMAEAAVACGQNILVVATLESALAPTVALLKSQEKRAVVATCIVPGAWTHFEAGDKERYFQAISSVVDVEGAGSDAVVLAQASMAGAQPPTHGPPVFSSPVLGVEEAIRRVRGC